MLDEEETRKRIKGKSLLGGRLAPHAHDREMASARAPGALLGQKAWWDWPLIPKPLLQPNLAQLLDLITLLGTIGSLHSPIRDEY